MLSNLANVCQAGFLKKRIFENEKRVTLTRPAIADRRLTDIMKAADRLV